LPAINDVMDRRESRSEGPPNKLTYFDKAIWQRHQERTAGPPDGGQSDSGGASGSTGPPWRQRLKSYRDQGVWPDMWGPAPGQRGCQAPRDLVSEILGKEAA
jgi:hypothetical protein